MIEFFRGSFSLYYSLTLSFAFFFTLRCFREKTPPYALDYTNPMNNISYETINNLKNKEILINNENAHLLGEKGALEKNLKKHSMFINALSWKKFNNNKKKGMEQLTKTKVGIPCCRDPEGIFRRSYQNIGRESVFVGSMQDGVFSWSLKNNGKKCAVAGTRIGFSA
jgi:hypothetical protein